MKLSKIFSLAGVAILASVVTGCSSVNTSDGASMCELKSKSIDYKPMYTFEKKKVSGCSNLNVLFGLISWGDNKFAENGALGSLTLFSGAAKAKAAAVYQACKNSNADTLLGSTYEIEETDYVVFKKVSCKVKGFPAKIVDIEGNDNVEPAKK